MFPTRSQLARWNQATPRAAGGVRVGAQEPQGTSAPPQNADHRNRMRWTAWDLVLPPDRNPRVYVCGATPFVEQVLSWLRELGHEVDDVRAERFGGS